MSTTNKHAKKYSCVERRVTEGGILCITKTREQNNKALTFFEDPVNVGLISGAGALGGLVVIPVLLKVFKFF